MHIPLLLYLDVLLINWSKECAGQGQIWQGNRTPWSNLLANINRLYKVQQYPFLRIL